MMVADAFEDAGFKVIEAADADEALRVLSAVPEIQVVVTDVEMPGGSINGFELARRIRTEWAIPVLVVSGRAYPSRSEPLNGAHFIAKPYRVSDLVELIRRELAR